MKRISVFAAAGLVVAAAVLRFCLPLAAHNTKEFVTETFLGTQQEDVPVFLFGQTVENSAPTVRIHTVEVTPVAQELPEAVSVFLRSQEQYADMDIPVSATYDYVTPPANYIVPVAGYHSSGYGFRVHPITNDVSFHCGTDIAAWTGDAVHCFLSGTVECAEYNEDYGNYVVVSHEDGWESLYAHCSELLVEPGQQVSAGEKIAVVGDSGVVTGPHLHFELKHNGVYVNPEYYLNCL